MNTNAKKSYEKIINAAIALQIIFILDNILDLILIFFLVWYIWFKMHWGFLGIIIFIFTFWVFHKLIFPKIVYLIKIPFINMAKSGVVRLATLNIIDDEMVKRLASIEVELWPKTIHMNMSANEAQEFAEKIENLSKD
ncbi:MAG: hypothetical protein KGH93_00325 [Patescibacteria group bacterium]|nr:hypothetical protein [Patescibacteria group bacterium]MDE1945638.1 hypothetical protein [Patescibacteria group bacterium]